MSVMINQDYPGFIETVLTERNAKVPGRSGQVLYMISVTVDAGTQVNVSFGPSPMKMTTKRVEQ